MQNDIFGPECQLLPAMCSQLMQALVGADNAVGLCRAGHLDPQKALALGVSPGKAFSMLKEGLSVAAQGE